MPFTLIHGALAFFFVSFFTKDKRLWILAFCAGMLPDIDGVFILFDRQLFYSLHHEILHPLIWAPALGLAIAFVASHFLKMDFKGSLAVFAFSFALHPVVDVFFTDWQVPLLSPFSFQQFSMPVFVDYNWLLWVLFPLMVAIPFARAIMQKGN